MPKRSRTRTDAPRARPAVTPQPQRPSTPRVPRAAPPPPPTLAERARMYWPWELGGLIAVAAVVAFLVLSFGNQSGGSSSGQSGATSAAVSTEENVPLEGNTHVPVGQPVQYKSYPPTSGTHYPNWANYGFSDREIPEGEWIHDLEHGAVVVLYKCEGGPTGCPDLVNQLKDVYATFPPGKHGKVKMVITPYTRMDNPVTLVAWGWREKLDRFDKDRVLRFYKAHVDHGPEDVP
ncbi:MAG: DUF3105 domain-containing protein [Chloroflexi bacterium]|nr:DUF3105 domain-containing protein [Chloroflexota bacterium]